MNEPAVRPTPCPAAPEPFTPNAKRPAALAGRSSPRMNRDQLYQVSICSVAPQVFGP